MNRILQFFQGRYGMDQLNLALLLCGFVVQGLNRLFFSPWVEALGLVFLLLAALRFLSRKKERRATENELFLSVWRPFLSWLRELRERWRDRKLYRYFHCPECSQTVRVPKRKGKIRISCPRCGNAFVKKT